MMLVGFCRNCGGETAWEFDKDGNAVVVCHECGTYRITALGNKVGE